MDVAHVLLKVGSGVKHRSIAEQLVVVGESFHHEQSHIAKRHLLQIVVAHIKRAEIVACHLIEQNVGVDGVGAIHQHKHLRLVGRGFQVGELLIGNFAARRIVGKCHGTPEHTACIRAAAGELSSGFNMLHNGRSGGCDIGFGIALQHFFEHLLKFFVIFFGNVCQRIDKHKLRHQFRKRISAHHFGIRLVHGLVIIV